MSNFTQHTEQIKLGRFGPTPERVCRGIRLASIWTGTNEVMTMIVAHEWYREHGKYKAAKLARDYARDAAETAGENIYE